MSTRKNMTFPIIIAFIFIIIIIYLFATIKQSEVSCSKTYLFDRDIRLVEDLVAVTDGKKIDSISLTKTIILPDRFRDDAHFKSIKNSLDNTLEYLGDDVKYNVSDDRIVVKINVDNDQLVLLGNIEFLVNNDMVIKINSNTKSSDVITLSVGDNYSDGELMKKFKNRGYTCQ